MKLAQLHMNRILNIILYIMSPMLIIGGLLALVGVSVSNDPGGLAIPVILVNGIVPIVTGSVITLKYITELRSNETLSDDE